MGGLPRKIWWLGRLGRLEYAGMDWEMSEKDQDGLGDDQERLSNLLSY
jgi:hypothetical protein